jgi:hypothetical protein
MIRASEPVRARPTWPVATSPSALPPGPVGGYRQRVDSLKAPSVTLRPMTDPEYDVWREHTIAWYAAAIGPARGLDPQAALRSASDQTSKLLPDGRSTAGHLLWTARHGGDPIGTLWISTGSPSAAYIFSVEVDEQSLGYHVISQQMRKEL